MRRQAVSLFLRIICTLNKLLKNTFISISTSTYLSGLRISVLRLCENFIIEVYIIPKVLLMMHHLVM